MKTNRTITREEILEYLRGMKNELALKYKVNKLGLFGSYARGEESENSDIDLLIDFQPDTPNLYDKKNEIKVLFESKFDRKVDLCTEKYVKPYFKNQILRSALYVWKGFGEPDGNLGGLHQNPTIRWGNWGFPTLKG